jgi:organic hydroperoxide reductase OsmC/OhrA
MHDGGLRRYITQKRQAMVAAAAARPEASQWREQVEASVVADDESGVRKLRIRGWEYVSDSGVAFGGAGLGPSSPELLCGVIGTCLTHTYEIGAATLDVPLDRIAVTVCADNNDAGLLGIASDDPDVPWGLTARVAVEARGVASADIERLHAFVRERCPLTKLIRTPNDLRIVVE